MRTTHIYIFFLLSALGLASCVDDYREANPELPKDSPLSTLTVEDTELVGGEQTQFTIRVVDAPGLIDSIGYATTDDKGTVEIDQSSLQAAQGNTEGTITGTFTAPLNASGEFTLTFYVYDAQGEQQKRHAVSEDLVIEYRDPAPSFTASADDEVVFPGESTNVYFDVTAPAMIQNVRVFTSVGTIELDEASLEAVRGETEGRVSAVFTAPAAPTVETPVTFTVFVADSLQEIEISEDVEVVSVGYEFEGPSVEIEGDESIYNYSQNVSYSLDVSAPGTVDTVLVRALDANSGEAIESAGLSFNEEELNAIIGSEGGNISFNLSPRGNIGYLDLEVTVRDEQGTEVTETIRVFSEECRTTNLAGTYVTVSNGTSTDACGAENPAENLQDEATITRVSPGVFQVNNFFAGVYRQWYGDCYGFDQDVPGRFAIDCEGNLSVIRFAEPYGSNVTGSGTYDAAANTITINWENGFGDAATTVYTLGL